MERLIQRRGTTLYAGEDVYTFAGFNNYYLMTWAADPGLRHHVDEVLDAAHQMGLTVCRTWAFCDGPDEWMSLQPQHSEHVEQVLEALNYVVWQANVRGIRLILPFVNNWPDYGGMDQYVAWSPTARRHDDFYIDRHCRKTYREHVRRIVERVNVHTGLAYRDEPTILAWELANEPRCASDLSGWTLQCWIEEMAGFLKSIEPNHLVTTGVEGFYGRWADGWNPPRWLDGQGCDFVWNHEPEAIDLATFHVYPDHWYMGEAESLRWMHEHLRDARLTLGKPVFVSVALSTPRAASKRPSNRCSARAFFSPRLKWRIVVRHSSHTLACLFPQPLFRLTEHGSDRTIPA